MTREEELIFYLKEPVRGKQPLAWSLSVPFNRRWVYKNFGGRARGRWQLFRSNDLTPHKPFSDTIIANLCAKGFLTRFCLENNRAFFLKELVENTPYLKYNTVERYRRVK